MKIYVCVKHVPDSAATITVVDAKAIDTGITFLVNPYDEHALTEAAMIAGQTDGAEVIAVCVGPPSAANTLRSALAMGSDRGILVSTEGETAGLPDSMATARALAAVITADGQPDLILTGKEGIDTEGMQTMFRLAQQLDMPAATNVTALELAGDHVLATCEKEPGTREVLQLTRPCVLAAGKGLNTPKYPTFPDIVKARKKTINTITWEQLDMVPAAGGIEIEHLEPADEARRPKALEGDAASVAAELVRILREEAKVL
ncbi:MAG: electron transfer flavoprotein subunit beta/FixA family protein [Desulfosarcinaceae bacterium]|nr:electron transfer flavoprotein subunit beta/FixA family protein [Desulfosarcinaceae bacterium]